MTLVGSYPPDFITILGLALEVEAAFDVLLHHLLNLLEVHLMHLGDLQLLRDHTYGACVKQMWSTYELVNAHVSVWPHREPLRLRSMAKYPGERL